MLARCPKSATARFLVIDPRGGNDAPASPRHEGRLTAIRRAGSLHSQMMVDEEPSLRKFSEEPGECNGLFSADSHFLLVGLLYKFKKAVPPALTGILEIHISLRKVNWRSGSRPRRSET